MPGNELCRAIGCRPAGQCNVNVDFPFFPFFQSFGNCLLDVRLNFGLEGRGKLCGSLPKGFLILFRPFGNLLVEVVIVFGAQPSRRREQQGGEEQQTNWEADE